MASELTELLEEINDEITTKTTDDSINPTILGGLLSRMTRYASSAYAIPFFTDDNGSLSDPSFVGVDIISVMFSGGQFFKGIQYTKDIPSDDVVYIDGNSLPPNSLVLLQTGDGSLNGGTGGTGTQTIQDVCNNGTTTTTKIQHAAGTQSGDSATLANARAPLIVTTTSFFAVLPQDNFIVYNGSADFTANMAPITANTGKQCGIKNISAFTVTLNVTGGSNEIWDQNGMNVNTIQIPPNSYFRFFCSGATWDVQGYRIN